MDIVQAVGRALRPAPGKQFGYVIVPILHDADATADDIFKSPAFKEILTTLRALAANDDRIIEYFRGVSKGQQRKGGGSVQFDIDERLAKRINLDDFAREIEIKCWDSLAKLSWRPFEEARAFVHSLGLKSETEWRKYRIGKLPEKGFMPPDIPSNPNRCYAQNGWAGMGDWLGTGTVAPRQRVYRLFEEAREFARRLGLKNIEEWREFSKGKLPDKGILPADIPADPYQAYRDNGWVSVGDWLGTGAIAPSLRVYRNFDEARAFVRKLGLSGEDQWRKYCKGKLPEKGFLPSDIPANPNQNYAKNGWTGMGDWLGTGNIAPCMRQFLPFEEARDFARGLGINGSSEWRKYSIGILPGKECRPPFIPANPYQTYVNDGWTNWGDWLGTGRLASQSWQYRPFDEARKFAQHLGLRSGAEWREYCRGKLHEKGMPPPDIPAKPERTYAATGWVGWGDWLGTGKVANQLRQYRTFEEARKFARALGLKKQSEWIDFCKGVLPEKGALPPDIPASPASKYAEHGWSGMSDWLGTGRTRVSKSPKRKT